jgi:hypothetical protein
MNWLPKAIARLAVRSTKIILRSFTCISEREEVRSDVQLMLRVLTNRKRKDRMYDCINCNQRVI